MKKYVAIVLAGGSGSRMNTKVHKQYLLLNEKPILYYSLAAFEASDIAEVILVVGAGEISYCQKEIVEKYHLKKVTAIVEGGKERYHSVYEGLKAIKEADFVLIHDGARPFINHDIIERAMDGAEKYRACVVGMPVKDTIKIADDEEFAEKTPDRKKVWMIQTPQAFEYNLIQNAYQGLMKQEIPGITDDAMVVEKMTSQKVKLVQGDYRNIKITTPEDLLIAEAYINH